MPYGNPLNFTDPNGLCPLTGCEKGVMAGFGIPQIDLDSADLHDGEVPGYLRKDIYAGLGKCVETNSSTADATSFSWCAAETCSEP